jgi:primosomal protein N' (replication factor Y)
LWIKVAVPVPSLGLLTYLVPDDQPRPTVGARTVVPLGTRSVTGVIVEVHGDREAAAAGFDPGDIKPVRAILDDASFVPGEIVELAQWTAQYYAAGVGDTITAVLPPMARGERADAHKVRRVAAITAAGLEPQVSAGADLLTPRQREALALLAAAPGGMATPELAARGVTGAVLMRLVRRGLVTVRPHRVDRDPLHAAPFAATPAEEGRRLTLEQSEALERLREMSDARTFGVALLHGVTGSGKTELYVRLAEHVRDSGRRVLLLVPEIALTPAVASIFREAFGARIAIQHSGLSDGERHDQWQRIRRGDVDVVVGTRSAVFAPVENVGVIVVDEEHDAAYKQEESPRYNGRDVAIVRGQRAGALVVLGSATPALETYHNALAGKYERIVLERRVLDRPLAAVTIVDMREEFAEAGPDVVLSRALRERLETRVAAGEQALVLLNRRGFATSVFCRQCGGTVDCPNCSVSLVVHGEGTARRARCHYCNYSARVPATCPLCAAPYLEQTGFGTERVEAEIKRACPDARVARLDRDAVRRKGALVSLLARFRSGALDVLVGTQMIAKGHDFPRVTLVGVISADVGLGMADFRASERTFQLLTQVAGRAGRGDQPGEAVIQTIYPDHYSIRLACRQDYPGFYAREIKFRQSMRYPPRVALINTIIRGRTFARAMDDAADVAARVRDSAGGHDDIRVLGPAPAPIGKIRGEYRAQLLVKGTNRRRMREALLAAIAARPELQRRTTIDVDPLSVI